MLNDSRSLVLYCSTLRMTVGRLGSQYDNKIYSNRDFVFINLFYYHPLIIIYYIIYLRDIYTMSLLLCSKTKSRGNFTLYSSILTYDQPIVLHIMSKHKSLYHILFVLPEISICLWLFLSFFL